MKIQSAILGVALAVSPAAAFSTSNHNIASSSSTQLYSTIPKPGTVTTSLTPPSKLDTSSTADLFESRVYKTYGRYPITFTSGQGCKRYDRGHERGGRHGTRR